MSVAKSYQSLEIVSEIFYVNSRPYVKVRMASGIEKTVRWYPEETSTLVYTPKKSLKERMGFAAGYITIFKGNTYSHLDWFHEIKVARYNKLFNWHIPSSEELPENIPADLTPIQVKWEDIIFDDGTLRLEADIKEYLDTLLFEPNSSQFVGTIGERIEINVVLTNKIQLQSSAYSSTIYIFETEDENVLTWTTSARRNWSIGDELTIKATVKDHKVYHNTNQTVLTRCN